MIRIYLKSFAITTIASCPKTTSTENNSRMTESHKKQSTFYARHTENKTCIQMVNISNLKMKFFKSM